MAAGTEEARPKTKKTAKEVIANATKENNQRWVDTVSDNEDDIATPTQAAAAGDGAEPIKVESGEVEVQDAVAVAEAKEEGLVRESSPPPLADSKAGLNVDVDEEDDDMEEVMPVSATAPTPATRTIRLKFNGSAPPARANKRKPPSPAATEDESPPPAKRKGRSAKAKTGVVKAEPAAPPTRSLRSRAPKTAEKQQADRDARARIRAALSEGDDDDVELEL